MRKPKAARNLHDREWLPTERMWFRVWIDALVQGDNDKFRDEIKLWFKKGNHLSDFDLICEDLGLDEDDCREWSQGIVRDRRGMEIKRLVYPNREK